MLSVVKREFKILFSFSEGKKLFMSKFCERGEEKFPNKLALWNAAALTPSDDFVSANNTRLLSNILSLLSK